jgi:transposase InsO family protein
VTHDDVLFRYRLQVLAYAAEHGVSAACRTFGLHRSTYYVWRRRAERSGLEMLRPRERRTPRMPNQLSGIIEQRILAFSLAHPGFGPRRISDELARPRWGGILVSPNGVWRCLRRHGLSTRAKRLGLVAGHRAPYEPPRDPAPEPHIEVSRPGELVGIDCFFVGRLRGTREPVWQVTAIDVYSSHAWAELCAARQPTHQHTSKLARRVAADLARCGWRLERVLSDNGAEFTSHEFRRVVEALGGRTTRIRAGRPQTNGHVENLHRTILEECWRPSFARSLYPAFTALRRDLAAYIDYYNTDRTHHGRITQGRIPADLIDPARKMHP